MKKKIVAICLALVMMLSVVSCGKESVNKTKTSEENKKEEKVETTSFKPNQDFNIRVPFAAGGAVDSIVRVFGQGLQKKYNRTALINNLTGANGTIAAADLNNAKSDATQLMAGGIFMFTLAPLFNPDNSLKLSDYKIVSGLIQEDFILFASPKNTNVKNWEEFKEFAKSNKVIFGSNAPGGTTHMLATMLFGEEGIDAEAVTSDGSAKDLLAVVSGTCNCAIANASLGNQYIEDGSLVPLLTFSESPFKGYDGIEVPTAKSFGRDIVFNSCNFLMTKSDVSDNDIKDIHDALVEYSKTEEFKEFAKKANYTPSLDDGATVQKIIENASAMCKKAYDKYYNK